MKIIRFVADLALVAVLGAACGGGGEGGGVTPTRTVDPRMFTPTPTATIDFSARVPAWERVGDSTAVIADYSAHFVADLETGDVWRLTAEGAEEREVVLRLFAWSPAGEALVSVGTASFLARPGEPFRHLEGADVLGEAPSSPDGFVIDSDGRLVDPLDGRVLAELESAPSEVGSWSIDGRYVTYGMTDGEDVEWFVWDWESGVSEPLPGTAGVWANSGRRLAYQTQSQSSNGQGAIEIRVYDVATGEDRLVTTVSATSARPAGWSFHDRYLEVSEFRESVSVRIIDMSGESPDVIIHGAWASAWLPDRHTLLVTGNVCSDFDIFTVDAGGDNLRNYTDSSTLDLYPRLSPDGRHVAITTIDEGVSVIRSIDLDTGGSDVVASGPGLTLWSASIPPPVVWSPDGRYVAFGIEGGHGLCKAVLPVDTTVEIVE